MAQDQGGAAGTTPPSTVVDIEQRRYTLPQFQPPIVPNAPTQQQQVPYDPQSIQGTPTPQQEISFATPTEQAAGQGGGVPEEINPYFADISAGMQYLYSLSLIHI